MGGDDVLELNLGLADHKQVVVGQAHGFEHRIAVAFDGGTRGETGKEHPGAAFFKPGMLRSQQGVVGQQQMALRIVADQGDGLADHEALALVASG